MKGKIFNSQEVQSILNGTKVMFREVIKTCKQHPKSLCTKTRTAHYSIDFTENGLFWRPYGGSGLQPYPYVDGKLSNTVSLDDYCPYKVGEEIFVKERFARSFDSEGNPIAILEADSKQERKWKPAQHMKQEQSRITLEITDVKVERLGEISEEDAEKEGIFKSEDYWHSTLHPIKETYQCWTSAKEAFSKLWNATHKKPEEKFEVNPFVWVVDFKINK